MKKNFNQLFKDIETFLIYDLWRIDKENAPRFIRHLLRPIRLGYMIMHGFMQKHTMTKAAALSYTTVLGLIPLLIIAGSFSKGFLEDQAEEFIPKLVDRVIENVAPHLDAVPIGEKGDKLKQSARDFAVTRISNILTTLDAREFGIYGIIALILIGYSLLRTIENTMNDIWNVVKGRTLLRQFLQYWICVTLVPAIIFLTMGLSGRHAFIYWADIQDSFGSVFFYAGPYIILWLCFALFYKIVPNASVRFMPALIGGIVGGTLWQINNMLSFVYISRMIRMKTIYGSIAIIPIFLLVMYCAWLIVLFGAHVAFAAQNLEMFRDKYLAMDMTPAMEQKIAIAAMLLIGERFIRGGAPPTQGQIAEEAGLPEVFFVNAFNTLLSRQLITATQGDPPGYIPARSPSSIRLDAIMNSVIGVECDGDDNSFSTEIRVWRLAENAANRLRDRDPSFPETLETLLEQRNHAEDYGKHES